MCQHGLSNKYLSELSSKLNEEDIYNKIDEIKFDGTIYRTDIGKIYES